MTNKQMKFALEYLRTWNATKAARAAGYRHPNVLGTRLLANPAIKAMIDERMAEHGMGADESLVRLSEMARAVYADYFKVVGDTVMVDLEGMKRDGVMHLVKSVKQTRFGPHVDFYDAQAALILIGRHHGLFKDRVERSDDTPDAEKDAIMNRLGDRIRGIAERLAMGRATGGSPQGETV